MRTWSRAAACSTLVWSLVLAAPVLGQSPILDSLSPTVAPRSGRVLLFGSGFGEEQGESRVLVDGLEAIVTLWLPDELHVYLPEGASLGEVEVQVVTGQGGSNPLIVEVTTREPDGRVRWRFQTDVWMTRQFVEVGPDGRVYTSDDRGLYALSADGALLWFVAGAGGGHPIDIGPDGTLYTGVTEAVAPEVLRALEPDGSPRWDFVPPVSWNTVAGPNVGPDGNIYAIQEFVSAGGLGFFSLDPQGALRWSNPGDPPLNTILALHASETTFTSDRLFAGVVHTDSGGNAVTYALDFDGGQIWYSGDVEPLLSTVPRVDPQGRVVGRWGQTGLVALEPDGDTAWISLHPNPNLLQTPAVDSQGNLYTGDLVGVELWSVTPDGTTRWLRPPEGGLRNLGVSPDDAVIVAAGSDGLPTWVRGYDPADGALLWQVDLPQESGWPQQSTNLYPAFSTDGRTAYLTTLFNNVLEVEYGYLLAIDIAALLFADDFESGDLTTWDESQP